MPKALVVYDSKTGNTEKMARAISEGIKEAGLDVEVKKVDDASLDDLIAADAIVLGSPTYFGTMSGKMKVFIDKSDDIIGKLQDKIGAAFTSSAGIAGGNETTLVSLIQAMLMHRMVIIGHQRGSYVIGYSSGSYGAVSIKAPDEECITGCRQFGKRIGSLVKR